jgi:hypothetical protein
MECKNYLLDQTVCWQRMCVRVGGVTSSFESEGRSIFGFDVSDFPRIGATTHFITHTTASYAKRFNESCWIDVIWKNCFEIWKVPYIENLHLSLLSFFFLFAMIWELKCEDNFDSYTSIKSIKYFYLVFFNVLTVEKLSICHFCETDKLSYDVLNLIRDMKIRLRFSFFGIDFS